MDKTSRMIPLIKELNQYRHEYYNLSKPSVSDEEYDKKFDLLKSWEDEAGYVFRDSPTHSVGYEVVSKLEKVQHNHPMLSLDKTKSIDDVLTFLNGREGIAMLKMDGLTCSCLYENGGFISAESRGNGEVGELITHNVKTITNLPFNLPVDHLIVDGEIIIDYDTFDKINNQLPEDEQYKNPRNLASGSARQLDSKIAAQRGMRFIAWKAISGIGAEKFSDRLETLYQLGFETTPHHVLKENITKQELESVIENLKSYTDTMRLPIDGIVIGFNDVAYGESLGQTGHHVRSQLAYKFKDDTEETILRNVEWNTTRSGQINPTAIFDTVIIDGTEVSRASLFNLTFINDLQLNLLNRVLVSKRNAIIPYIEENMDRQSENYISIPDKCPTCHHDAEIWNTGKSDFLYCTNLNCPAKLLDKFVHFVSRDAMNIEGLSEATLEKFINKGWLKTFDDIYKLNQYKDQIVSMDGFGERSYQKMIEAIEKSRTVKLENFIYALGMPNIGKGSSKIIAKQVENDFNQFVQLIEEEYDWTQLKDFGDITAKSIDDYMDEIDIDGHLINFTQMLRLSQLMSFIKDDKKEVKTDSIFSGLKIYCTGTFANYKKDELKEILEDLGAEFASGYAKCLDYLIVGSVKGSSKEDKARKDGVKVLFEEEFIKLI